MPELATTLVLGLITGYLKDKATGLLKSGADTALQRLFDHLKSRLEDKTIPATHDLHQAVEASLLDATRAFAYAVAADLGESPPLLDAIRQHWKNGTFSSTPILEMRTVPGADWVRELLTAADHAHTTPGKGIASHFLLTADALPTLVTHTQITHTATPLQQQVDTAFTTWLTRHVQDSTPPPCVAGFLTHGWPLHKDSPQRIRFYEAFIRFFHHRIATVPVVKDILLVHTTAHTSQDVKTLLKQLRLSDTTLRKWLDSQALSLREIQEHTRLLPGIQKAVKAIRRTTRKTRAAVQALQSGALRIDPLEQYKAALRDSYGIYDELGSPITSGSDSDAKPVTIGDIFVHPSCAPSRYAAPEFDAALQSDKAPGQPLLPLLEQHFTTGPHRRVVLIGDPGMGKSTLIKWLIVSPLLKGKARPAAVPRCLRDAIPLPFIIRDLVRHLPEDPAQWDWPALTQAFRDFRAIRHATKPLLHAFDGDDAAFESLLTDPRALYLVDGLDEISDPKKRTAIRDALWQGFDATPQARWLLTSRWIGYEESPIDFDHVNYWLADDQLREHYNPKRDFAWTRWEEYYLQLVADLGPQPAVAEEVRRVTYAHRLFLTPFTDPQQDDYARNWFTARKGRSLGPARATSLMQEIRRSENLRILSRVPNLLCLMALLKLQDVPLPDGRAQLYETITTAYLKTIDEVYDLNAKHGHRPPCDMKNAIRWLSIIAMHLQVRRTQAKSDDSISADKSASEDNSEILATHAELEEWLRPEISRTHPGQEAATLRDFLRHISQRTAFLQERGEGQYGFIHLSFQEYYAACWLEREFRRQNQTHTAADDWLAADPATTATPPPAPPLQVTADMWPQFADTPAWQEPLIFLAEKLTDEHDVRTLRTWLFPLPKGELPPLALQAARLLATLSVDKQVNLPASVRTAIWRQLFRTWLALQPPREKKPGSIHAWHVAPVLLGHHSFQHQVLTVLSEQLTAAFPSVLCLNECTALASLDFLQPVTSLEYLELWNCSALTDISALAHHTGLLSIDFGGCTELQNLSPLRRLTSLTRLDFSDCTSINDLTPLSELGRLKALDLSNCTSLINLFGLEGLSSLQALILNGCVNLDDITSLEWLTGLLSLSITGPSITDLTPLAALSHLVHLVLHDCVALVHADILSSFPQLAYLSISQCSNLQDLAGLSKSFSDTRFNLLTDLSVQDCASLEDVSALQLHTSLQSVSLSGCASLTEATALHGLYNLQTLDLSGCTSLQRIPAPAYLEHVRHLNLRGCESIDPILLEIWTSRTLCGCEILPP